MFFLYSDNNSSLKWSLPKLILRVVWGYFVKPLSLHSLAQYILVPIPCADYDLLWHRHVVKYMEIMHLMIRNSIRWSFSWKSTIIIGSVECMTKLLGSRGYMRWKVIWSKWRIQRKWFNDWHIPSIFFGEFQTVFHKKFFFRNSSKKYWLQAKVYKNCNTCVYMYLY